MFRDPFFVLTIGGALLLVFGLALSAFAPV